MSTGFKKEQNKIQTKYWISIIDRDGDYENLGYWISLLESSLFDTEDEAVEWASKIEFASTLEVRLMSAKGMRYEDGSWEYCEDDVMFVRKIKI